MTDIKQITTSSENSFEQALAYLVINSDIVPNQGLYHGKVGLVLFFSIYAHYSENNLYDRFAFDLLDEVYEDIHRDVSLNFENGLCGIGWAIEYLVQNGYMEGDTDDVLEDIDNRIMEYDVRRISDLSFRRGLAGVAYYICARLSAVRDNDTLPFNPVFLDNLKEALLNAQFTEKDEVPPGLIDTYLNALNGIKPSKLELPASLLTSNSHIPDNLHYISLGLENGLAGIMLQLVLKRVQVSEVEQIFNPEKKCVVIFNEESRAAAYGVGTYIQLLTDAIKNDQYNMMVVHLRSHKVNSILIEKQDDITQICIGNSKTTGYNYDWEKLNERYYRNALLLLSPYLSESNRYIFQLNYMGMEKLGIALKSIFVDSQILITVHYTSWSFALLGDRDRLREVIDCPNNKENERLYKSIESERQFLNVCDRVIGIAKHSYDDLINIYKIPESKLAFVPHGLKDFNSHITKKDRKLLRQKYGFTEKDQILIFAGRLDVVKGIEILAESFVELQKQYPRLRLIIAGEGSYNSIFSKLAFGWSRVVFTGFVDKTILYELFSISDIGVLPSLHEEFGYVALEMMMMGLPLVVGRTSGLSELVVDGVSGITVALNKEKKEENNFALQTAVKELLDNSILRKQYARNGRLRFLQNYNFEKFEQLTKACFE